MSVLFFIMTGANLRIGIYPLLPTLFLIPTYYWLVFRPRWLPLYSLVCIGLFYDTLMGSELGLSSLLLMMSAGVGYSVRPLLNPQHFFLIWGGYCCYSLCYLILYGIFVSGGFPLLFSWIFGVILYPPMACILSHLHLRLQAHV